MKQFAQTKESQAAYASKFRKENVQLNKSESSFNEREISDNHRRLQFRGT